MRATLALNGFNNVTSYPSKVQSCSKLLKDKGGGEGGGEGIKRDQWYETD